MSEMSIRKDNYPVPPESLRWRVVGNRDEGAFLESSQRAIKFFNGVLGKAGKSFSDFDAILDFGCGCGRLIRSLPQITNAKLFGSDIDAEAINWCDQNIKDAKFSVNGEYPPLPFESNSFDLIYASSVFTHIDEEHQFKWLEELKRVSKPGGFLILTFREKHNVDQIANEGIRKTVEADLERKGISYIRTKFWEGIFPDWYGGTYHTPEYIRENWGRYFNLIDLAPPGVITQSSALLQNI